MVSHAMNRCGAQNRSEFRSVPFWNQAYTNGLPHSVLMSKRHKRSSATATPLPGDISQKTGLFRTRWLREDTTDFSFQTNRTKLARTPYVCSGYMRKASPLCDEKVQKAHRSSRTPFLAMSVWFTFRS